LNGRRTMSIIDFPSQVILLKADDADCWL